MSDSLTDPSPRRGFLGRLAGVAASLAGGALVARDLHAQTAGAAGVAGAAARPARQPASTTWDMSWVDRLRGPHKQLFDSPTIADGAALHQARTWMADFAEVYGATDADMSGVIVIRHAAISMVLNDALWNRLEIARLLANPGEDEGEKIVLKDPTTGELARRNPFLSANVKADDRHALIWPDGGIDRLVARGQTVLACNLALRRAVAMVQKVDGGSGTDARKTVMSNLLPGVIVMPSGIFAVARAQEAGCHFLTSAE